MTDQSIKAVLQPAPIRVTDLQAQFPALARALALWNLAPQVDQAACWNAFVDVEVELEKVLNDWCQPKMIVKS